MVFRRDKRFLIQIRYHEPVQKLITQVALLCAAAIPVVSGSAAAQTAPSPAAKATPNPFSYNGYVRGFYFTRTNLTQNGGNPNRKALNFGVKLHGEYKFGSSPFSVGATYFGADPFGANGDNPGLRTEPLNPFAPVSKSNPLVSKVDNTLPGFALSTLGEAWLQYKTKQALVKVGDQQLNYDWAPASDSRLKPALYEAADAQLALSPRFTLGLNRTIAFEHRTSSQFLRRTLVTDTPAGNPGYAIHDTSGMALAYLGYKYGTQFTGSLNFYRWYDIANMIYVTGKYFPSPKSHLKPFVAAQYVSENQTGSALLGKIQNTTIGMQLGASLTKNVDVAVGFDHVPGRIDTFNGTCAQAASAYFLPGGGTPNCVANPDGTSRIYYGGMISPYTEAYATDPLFTTSISQGMADRHSPGDSFKVGATLQTNDKRLKFVVSQAFYDYGSGAGSNATKEFDADATYFLNKVPAAGAYRGFSVRHRYADRVQPTLPFDFKYNRTQLQYDF